MDLNTGHEISRHSVTEVPITDLVIQHVEQMAAAQGIKSLKILNQNKKNFQPTHWLEGVAPQDADNSDDDEDDDEDEDPSDQDDYEEGYEEDEEIDDEDVYERIDQSELDEILSNPRRRPEPIEVETVEEEEQEEEEEEDEPTEVVHPEDDESAEADVEDSSQEPVTDPGNGRPVRMKREPDRLTYNQVNEKRKVRFVDAEVRKAKLLEKKLEQSHCIMADKKFSSKTTQEYTTKEAMVAARMMVELNQKVEASGMSDVCFTQQYML